MCFENLSSYKIFLIIQSFMSKKSCCFFYHKHLSKYFSSSLGEQSPAGIHALCTTSTCSLSLPFSLHSKSVSFHLQFCPFLFIFILLITPRLLPVEVIPVAVCDYCDLVGIHSWITTPILFYYKGDIIRLKC